MDKALLTRATSKDDTPTPGYLYGEIARMTQHSYDTSSKVMEFLITRVKNKHHNIKYKALQVIKHVCPSGRVDFKREMQKHIPTIKECLQFRGPPDPLKGDEYYRRVRDAAKECLDAIYDTDNTQGLGNMGISARIQGVGNPADQQSGGSGWGSKFAWGKSDANSNNMPPPSNIGSLPSYNNPGGFNGGGGGAGYAGDPNANGGGGYGGSSGGYGGQAPGGYGGGGSQGYGGPPQGGYGGPTGPAYGQQPPPYSDTPGGFGAPPAPFGGPSQFGGGPPGNDQKISGFGNPLYQDPRDEKSGFFKGLAEKAASKFAKPDARPTFGGAPPGSANPPDGWSFATNRGPTSGAYGISAGGSYNPNETYQPGGGYNMGNSTYGANDQQQSSQMTQLKEKAYDGDRKKGRVGGAWMLESPGPVPTGPPAPAAPARDNRTQSYGGEGRNRATSRGSEYGYQPQQQQQPKQEFSLAPAAPPRQTSGAQSDGNYERGLVQALCAPGGMRAIPPKDKLDGFIKSALTLDAEIVGPMLEDCLADAQWTVVSKALATIDVLIKSDGCEEYTDYFTENFGEIESCAKSDKAAVRDRAVKILNHLGQGSSVSAPPHAAAAPSARASRARPTPTPARTTEPDLLGFGDDEPSDDGGSLFSGLQASGVVAPVAAAPTPAPAATTSTNDVLDMFGGMNLQGNSPVAAPPAAPAATPPAAPPAPASTSSTSSSLILDPLLEPVSVAQTVNRGMGAQMNMSMGMMNPQQMQMQQMAQMQQMQQMQYMQQMQQMQFMQMQQQQMPGMGMGMGMAPAGVGMGSSQVIGAAMTPMGYIAKTIHEPTEEAATSDTGFNFMNNKKDDSFNFIKDAMKNS